MFKVIMIKGCDKITHFDNSDNDFCDNVITSDNVITLSHDKVITL